MTKSLAHSFATGLHWRQKMAIVSRVHFLAGESTYCVRDVGTRQLSSDQSRFFGSDSLSACWLEWKARFVDAGRQTPVLGLGSLGLLLLSASRRVWNVAGSLVAAAIAISGALKLSVSQDGLDRAVVAQFKLWALSETR